MDERDQNLVVADDLDSPGARPAQDVHLRAVLGFLVEVRGHQPGQVGAEVSGQRNGFEEHFRHDDSAADVQPEAFGHSVDDAAQQAEIDERRFAHVRSGHLRVHVDDVSPDGDVDGAGDSRATGGADEARVRVRAADVVDVLAQRGAKPDALLAAGPGGAGEGLGRFAGHAELTPGKLGGYVFTRLASKRELEVMDGRGSVHGDALDDAAFDPVDEVGGAADLDDVTADRRRDGALFAVAADNVVA